jgi:hypothetical protein
MKHQGDGDTENIYVLKKKNSDEEDFLPFFR